MNDATPDIVCDLRVNAPADRVFDAVSTPTGLDAWWTLHSDGQRSLGEEFTLDFGPGYLWRARVSILSPAREFELEMTDAHEDWLGTRVGFELTESATATTVRFRHVGWPTPNEHYRISCYCWPAYLRLMRRNVEHGGSVPYDQRLDV